MDNVQAWNSIAASHESTTPLDFAQLLTDVPKSARFLEVGCGYGRVLDYLKGEGFGMLTGVDPSPVMVDRCRLAGVAGALVASATKLPFVSNSFDVVLCIATLSSVAVKSERERSMREMARVLKPGGRLLLRDFEVTLTLRRSWRYVVWFRRSFRLWNFVTSEGIEFHHFRRREVIHLFWLAGLKSGTVRLEAFTTMHGNSSRGFTAIGRKETRP